MLPRRSHYIASVLLMLCSLVRYVSCYEALSNWQLKHLTKRIQPKDSLNIYNKNGLIQPILIERVSGTEGSRKVQEFIKSVFEGLNTWEIEADGFNASTPLEDYVEFSNLIFTRYPPSYVPGTSKRLILAAHIDSKIEPKGFVGAIDSAVPCALILETIKSLDAMITENWESGHYPLDTAVQVVFFDGEEAFVTWTNSDSIYGSRHLASRWQNANMISDIECLVLFDILGGPDPLVPSYFENTYSWHRKFADIEQRINRIGRSNIKSPHRTFFPKPEQLSFNGEISDDHIPFLALDVPILHVIPCNFPPQWHTIEDDADHLDQDTIYEWSTFMTVFLAEYLELGSVDFIKDQL